MAQSRNNPQLDAFRGVAITIVMLHHFLITPFFLSGFGVTIFFALSGYFTTSSLLGLRERVNGGAIGRGAALRFFLLRKYLRIFPVYSLLLIGTLVLNIPYAREGILWNATFLTNFWMLHTGEWPGRFSPMWSLSIVEQFYLAWSIIVLTCPKWRLMPIVLCAIASAPLYRGICHIHSLGMGTMWWFAFPLADLDSLGCGALLALCQRELPSRVHLPRAVFVGKRISGPILLGIVALKLFGIELPFSAIYIPLVASLFFMWLIHAVSKNSRGAASALLSWPLLSSVGRMSYSIFLFHNFTELLLPVSGIFGTVLATNFRVVILIPVTLFYGSLSWRFIEKPVLDWRDSVLRRGSRPSPQARPVADHSGFAIEHA